VDGFFEPPVSPHSGFAHESAVFRTQKSHPAVPIRVVKSRLRIPLGYYLLLVWLLFLTTIVGGEEGRRALAQRALDPGTQQPAGLLCLGKGSSVSLFLQIRPRAADEWLFHPRMATGHIEAPCHSHKPGGSAHPPKTEPGYSEALRPGRMTVIGGKGSLLLRPCRPCPSGPAGRPANKATRRRSASGAGQAVGVDSSSQACR